MGGTGLELNAVSAESATASAELPEVGGAKCGAFGQISGEIDADLQAVIDAWPGLTPETRVEVMAIIEADERAGRTE